MKLGYKYYRSALIKLTILSVVMSFILWDFFTGNKSYNEPLAIYLAISLWIGGAVFLIWRMVQAKRHEDGGKK
jgi:hypothetical protein